MQFDVAGFIILDVLQETAHRSKRWDRINTLAEKALVFLIEKYLACDPCQLVDKVT